MTPDSSAPRRIRFGVFEADLQTGELRKHGIRIRLQAKPFQVLVLLLENAGEVVTREDLRAKLWPADTFVDFDHGVSTAVKKLREALGDSAETPRFIETIPRRGYRFLAPVEFLEATISPQPEATQRSPVSPRAPVGKTKLAVGAMALVALTGALGIWMNFTRTSPPRGRTTLMVLPFKSLGGGEEQEYFCGGMTEEITAQLGQVRPDRLGVIARTTATLYSESHKPITDMARDLHLDYVVEGSVRQEQNRLRITAQLIRTSDQTHVWAQSYEQDMASAIGIQREIARRVADSLALELLPEEKLRASHRETSSPAAYANYLKGRFFRELATERGFRKGIEYFTRAIDEDPSYAPAYAGLAGCYCLLGGHGLELEAPTKVMPHAKEMASKALALDDRLPEAYGVLGMIQLKYEWDLEGANQHFQKAVELNPSYAQGHLWRSFYFQVQGRFEEAIASALRAKELDPLSVRALVNLAAQYYTAGRYDEATQELRQALEMQPDFWPTRWILGDCLERQRKYPEAIRELERAVQSSGSDPAALSSLGYTYAVAGRKQDARRTLGKIQSLMETRYVSPFTAATVYVGLGEPDAAFAWLEKAFQSRSRSVVWLRVDPRYRPLHSDPRFAQLLKRLNLPD